MKQFLLFAGDNRPDGGWNDFVGDFFSAKDAEEYMNTEKHPCDWFHIIDSSKNIKVLEFKI